VNNSTKHKRIQLLLMVAVLSTALSSCQNRKNGLFGSDNWGRNGYSNAFLNTGVNPYIYSGEGQVIGYLVQSQGIGASTVQSSVSPQSGGVQPVQNNAGPNYGAGGIAGGAQQSSGETPCTFKVAAVSPISYSQGSNQNFASMYNEAAFPSSGRGVYQTGGQLGVTCGLDSEVAATQTTFFITGGSNSNYLYAYRANSMGASLGNHTVFTIGPNTKVTASPSGHAVAITNNGASLMPLMENRIGGDGGRVADQLLSIPAQNGAKFVDVVIDDRQGAVWASMKYPDGTGQVLIFRLIDLFSGVNTPVFNSMQLYVNRQSVYNFNHNLPSETAVQYLFRQAMPLKIKNNNGMTGVLTASGHPFFMETGLGLDPALTVNKSPEDLNEIYQTTTESDMTVQEINVFDPFQTGYHSSSPYTQPTFQYKDFVVARDDVAYFVTEKDAVYAINLKDPMGASTPRERRLNMGMRINTIEMSYDLKYAIIAGSNGVTIGNDVGGNLVFNSTGRPDIQDANVIHASALAKVTKVRIAPQNQPAAKPATASAENTAE
jgi:hypothetical protein